MSPSDLWTYVQNTHYGIAFTESEGPGRPGRQQKSTRKVKENGQLYKELYSNIRKRVMIQTPQRLGFENTRTGFSIARGSGVQTKIS